MKCDLDDRLLGMTILGVVAVIACFVEIRQLSMQVVIPIVTAIAGFVTGRSIGNETKKPF